MESSDEDPLVECFTNFQKAGDVAEISSTFSTLCREAGLDKTESDPGSFLYAKLRQSMPHQHHKTTSFFKVLDERAALKEYEQQTVCRGLHVLVVGAGPVGLRAAVEAAFLGAHVDLVEKRDSFSRNNVLHLWPFLVKDLKALGIKKFVGKFGTGGIDHISE